MSAASRRRRLARRVQLRRFLKFIGEPGVVVVVAPDVFDRLPDRLRSLVRVSRWLAVGSISGFRPSSIADVVRDAELFATRRRIG